MKGFVYVIDNGDLVKVGMSSRPDERIAYLERSGGFKCKNKYVSNEINNPSLVEAESHNKLSEFRVIGEWFCSDYTKSVDVVKSVIESSSNKEKSKIETDHEGLSRCLRSMIVGERLSNKKYMEEYNEAVGLALGCGDEVLHKNLKDFAGDISISEVYRIQSICAKRMLMDAIEILKMKGVDI